MVLTILDAVYPIGKGQDTPGEERYWTRDQVEQRRNGRPMLLSKRYAYKDGRLIKNAYDSAYLFGSGERAIPTVEALTGVLRSLEDRVSSCVIRGERVLDTPSRYVQRTSREVDGRPPSFRAVDRAWICLDIDDIEAPEGWLWDDPWALGYELLPKAIRDQRPQGVWQYSSSSRLPEYVGAEPPQVIKAHVWFLLDRPVCDASIKAWLEAEQTATLRWDRALFSAVQIHYTAGPILRGVEDPHPERTIPQLDGPPALCVEGLLHSSTQWQAIEQERRAARAAELAELAATRTTRRMEGADLGDGQGFAHVLDLVFAHGLEAQLVEEALASTPHGDHNLWIGVGANVKEVLGDAGITLWLSWSLADKGDRNADVGEWEARWEYLPTSNTPHEALAHLVGPRLGNVMVKDWLKARGVSLGTPVKPERVASPAAVLEHALELDDTSATLLDRLKARTPREIRRESRQIIAGQLVHQLALDGVAPVLDSGNLYAFDPSHRRWHLITPAHIATLLQEWCYMTLVGPRDFDKDGREKPRPIFSGSHGADTAHKDVCLLAQQARPDSAVRLCFADEALRADIAGGKLVRERLAASHFAREGFDFSLDEVLDASAPTWLTYLHNLFDGQEHVDIKVEYLLRWCALAIFGASTSMQAHLLIIKGKAGTGKSTLGKIIESIMPVGSSTSVPLQEWGKENQRALMIGKLLNFVPELEINEPVGDLDQVKKIIFGELTGARFLYRDAVTFKPQAAHLFCGNGLPNMKKADNAVYKRFAQLEITAPVRRGTSDERTDFAEHLIETELPGILRTLVEAMQRALADAKARAPGTSKGLPIVPGMVESNDAWRRSSDAVALFLDERYEDSGSTVASHAPTLSAVYREFKEWCTDNGYYPMNRGTFKVQASNFYDVAVSSKQDVLLGAVRRPDAGPRGF